MLTKTIDRSLCDGCGKCIRICRASKVLAKGEDGLPRYEKEHKCIECGHCLAICPRGAISFTLEEKLAEDQYLAPSRAMDCGTGGPTSPLELLASLRSTRFFEGRDVEKAKLELVLEAMVRAPSAGNEQNRNFTILDSKRKVDELDAEACLYHKRNSARLSSPMAKRLAARALAGKDMSKVVTRNRLMADLPRKEREALCLGLFDDMAAMYAAGDYSLFGGASAAILVTSNTNTAGFHKTFHKADVEIAVTYGTIAAAGLGLSTCRMGLTEIAFGADRRLREKYGIPPEERVDGVLALGYSALEWKRIPPRGPVKAVWI